MSTKISLNYERIAQSALDLIDEAGIEGFSMRMLGRRLGVDPMAVYHYLPNKDAVFDAVVETLWRGVQPISFSDEQSWQQYLHTLFHAVRLHLLQHPRAVLLLGTRPATTPALLNLIEQMLAALHAAQLPAREAMPLLDCLSAFTVGKVLGEVSQQQQQEKVAAAVQSLTVWEQPNLMQALAEGYGYAPETQFDRGLRALIAGWAAL